MPYALAAAFALGALLMWFRASSPGATRVVVARPCCSSRCRWRRAPSRSASRWCSSCSTLADSDERLRASMLRAVPFAVLAVGGRGRGARGARPRAGRDAVALPPAVGGLARRSCTLWHTVAPVSLTPLDVLPLEPGRQRGHDRRRRLLGLLARHAGGLGWRHAWPSMLAALDRVSRAAGAGRRPRAERPAGHRRSLHLPARASSSRLASAGAGARWAARDARADARLAVAAVVIVGAGLVVASREALAHWSDSISLWTRVVDARPGERRRALQPRRGAVGGGPGRGRRGAVPGRCWRSTRRTPTPGRTWIGSTPRAWNARRNDLAATGRPGGGGRPLPGRRSRATRAAPTRRPRVGMALATPGPHRRRRFRTCARRSAWAWTMWRFQHAGGPADGGRETRGRHAPC